jgi:hypothetical protein
MEQPLSAWLQNYIYKIAAEFQSKGSSTIDILYAINAQACQP